MTNKYLSYDAQRAPRVREMFSRLAWRYDLVNDVMSFGLHRRWKRETVRLALAGARMPPRVLDLCCGSGDLSFLAERGGAATVLGVDFTLPMLAVARRRRAQRASRCRFVQADALTLPFPEASFDAVTIGYGLRNVADRADTNVSKLPATLESVPSKSRFTPSAPRAETWDTMELTALARLWAVPVTAAITVLLKAFTVSTARSPELCAALIIEVACELHQPWYPLSEVTRVPLPLRFTPKYAIVVRRLMVRSLCHDPLVTSPA